MKSQKYSLNLVFINSVPYNLNSKTKALKIQTLDNQPRYSQRSDQMSQKEEKSCPFLTHQFQQLLWFHIK